MSLSNGKRYEIAWRDPDGSACGAYGTPEELARILADADYVGSPIPLRGDNGRVFAFVSSGIWTPLS